MVGCVPGAMASNVLTLLAKGNASYSVSLTTSATLLSPLAVPIALRLALGFEGIDKQELLHSAGLLTIMVVAPVVAGYLGGRWLPQFEKRAKAIGSSVANVVILWVIAVVVAANYERLSGVSLLLSLPWALLAINLAGYLAGYFGGWGLRLPEGMRRALTLEIGMQNAGLGATLAAELFVGRDIIALPPALYMFGCMVTGTLLAQWWSRRPPTAESSGDEPVLGD